jgi:hypothetical protein
MRDVDRGWSAIMRKHPQEIQMDTTTLLVIVVIVLLIGGGGFYGRGRWY